MFRKQVFSESQPFAKGATTSPARLASDSVAGRRYIKS